jgi:hypothetical protein
MGLGIIKRRFLMKAERGGRQDRRKPAVPRTNPVYLR